MQELVSSYESSFKHLRFDERLVFYRLMGKQENSTKEQNESQSLIQKRAGTQESHNSSNLKDVSELATSKLIFVNSRT